MNFWRIVGGSIAYLIASFFLACAVGAHLRKRSGEFDKNTGNSCTDYEEVIPLSRAVLCLECNSICKAPGEMCPRCQAVGSFLSLNRILNPTMEHGEINYLCVSSY
jgi:hypothetical protein